MRDLIARCLTHVLELLLPSKGEHRAEPIPAPAPTVPRQRCALPGHKSPYAREAAEGRSIEDTLPPVRPFLFAPRHQHPDDLVRAERRWALDMAARGIDVGPETIHGVHIKTSSRTLHIPMGDVALVAA